MSHADDVDVLFMPGGTETAFEHIEQAAAPALEGYLRDCGCDDLQQTPIGDSLALAVVDVVRAAQRYQRSQTSEKLRAIVVRVMRNRGEFLTLTEVLEFAESLE